MKGYSDNTRLFMKFKGGVKDFNKFAGNPEVMDFIRQNPETITQKVSLGFNEPDDPETRIKVKLSVTGPELTKWHGKAKELMEDLGMPEDMHNSNYKLGYMKIECPTDPEAFKKVKPLIEALRETEDVKRLRRKGIDFDIDNFGDNLVIRFLICIDSDEFIGTPAIPKPILDTLSEVDQGVEFNLDLGTSLGTIMKEEAPVADHLLEGFKV